MNKCSHFCRYKPILLAFQTKIIGKCLFFFFTHVWHLLCKEQMVVRVPSFLFFPLLKWQGRRKCSSLATNELYMQMLLVRRTNLELPWQFKKKIFASGIKESISWVWILLCTSLLKLHCLSPAHCISVLSLNAIANHLFCQFPKMKGGLCNRCGNVSLEWTQLSSCGTVPGCCKLMIASY